MKAIQNIIVIVTLIAGVFIPKPLNAQANAPPISVNLQRTFTIVIGGGQAGLSLSYYLTQ
jgi:hypothetical protein